MVPEVPVEREDGYVEQEVPPWISSKNAASTRRRSRRYHRQPERFADVANVALAEGKPFKEAIKHHAFGALVLYSIINIVPHHENIFSQRLCVLQTLM